MAFCFVDDSFHPHSVILRTLARNVHWSPHEISWSSRKTLLCCLRGALLQREGDQVSKSSLRHRVLTWKEAVVRIQADSWSPLRRFGEDVVPVVEPGRLEWPPRRRTRSARLARSVTVRGRLEGSGGDTLRGRQPHLRAIRSCRSRRASSTVDGLANELEARTLNRMTRDTRVGCVSMWRST
jgi:hypothetical protein